MKQLIIIGTGGFAIELYEHIQNSIGYSEEFLFKGFIEGDIDYTGKDYSFLPGSFLGGIKDYKIMDDDVFTLAVADPVLKERLATIAINRGCTFINIIHKTVVVSQNATLGEGIILAPFTIVTSNAIIEDFVMLNTYSGIGHNSKIGKYSSVMGHVGINGHVTVGHHTFWGAGAQALPGSNIGDFAKVGACSLVLRRVKAGDTVFGVPAKSIK